MRRVPKRLEDGVLLEGVGVKDASSDYKICLYYPILDAFLSELRRFTSTNVSIMKEALQSCNPVSNHFLNTDHLQPLVDT